VYPTIIAALQAHGTVLTEHVGDQALDGAGESDLEAREIFQRDVDWVDQADLLVAEVTTPSLGVGYEIGRAEGRGIPVIALFSDRAGRRLSAMVAGNPWVQTIRYSDPRQIPGAIQDAVRAMPG
jgi:nucleoside 2-deoxyribosyltransferase